MKALIVPSLCSPIVLGLPFLHANRLVIDVGSNSIVDKNTNRNILDTTPPPDIDKRSPRERREAIRTARDAEEREILEQEELKLEE